VSGKSVPGALYMAVTSSVLEAEARRHDEPAALLEALNERLFERLSNRRMFVALLYLVLDPEGGCVRLASAGQIPPVLLRSDGGVDYVDVRGLPVGGLRGVRYSTVDLVLQPGDALVLTTDGVVEAESDAGDQFGFERLPESIAAARRFSADGIVDWLFSEVQLFAGSTEAGDDVTVVVVRRRG